MKTNWPAFLLACLLLATAAYLACPMSAQTGPLPTASTALATTIAQVEVGRSGQEAIVRVQGNGRLFYQASRLNDPERLVLDFTGVQVALDRTRFPGNSPVRGVRIGQFKPDVARVVIDLERPVPYSVKADGQSVRVAFAALAPSPEAPRKSVAPTARLVPRRPATITGASAAQLAAIESARMPLPAWLTEQTAVLATPVRKWEPPAPPEPAQQAEAQAPPQQPAKRYSGEPISVNLKDVDLKDFFRLIHEISGLNVVVDPSVKGTLTIVLDDVPWDQALDIVMRNNSLDKQLEGNVLRVATKETLKKEAETRRDLAKAEAEAVDQVTATRVLSYAKATGMRDTLKRFLSSRGDILADERSNTLIIRDIPSVIPGIDNLIRQLDRKGQQVEIEARVVAASRSFARDIGTQFGFATSTTGSSAAAASAGGFRDHLDPAQHQPRGTGADQRGQLRPQLTESGAGLHHQRRRGQGRGQAAVETQGHHAE